MALASGALPTEPPAPPIAWGYFATFGWVLLTYLVALGIALAGLYFWNPAATPTDLDLIAAMSDARHFSTTTIFTNLIQTGLLVAIIWFGRWKAKDYLAINWPALPEVKVALASLVILLPALDAAAYLSGQAIIPPFMTDIYRNALSTGAVPLLWLAVVVAAPVAEEIIFRGFLYRGWVRSPRNPLPGILILAAFFAILHLQYDWFGILQVFAMGLLLTYIRWRSGSMLLPMLLHVIANAYAMAQVTVLMHWLR